MISDDELVKDVVCGMIKPKNQMAFTLIYKGESYYFCSKVDKEIFEANPDRWVKRVGN